MTDPDYGKSPYPKDIKAILKKAKAKWTDQGWIIEDSLNLINLGLTRLSLIKEVGGDFNCNLNQLKSLKGASQTVGLNFYCNNNQLITLEGGPQFVGGNFYCNNKLTSLEGGPQFVGGDFDYE